MTEWFDGLSGIEQFLFSTGIFSTLIFAVQFGVATYMVAVVMGKGMPAARLEILLVIVMLALATNGGGALNLGTMLRRGA